MFFATPYYNFDKDGIITGRLYVNENSSLYLFGYKGYYCIASTFYLSVNNRFYTNYKTFNDKNYFSDGNMFIWWNTTETAGYRIGYNLGRYDNSVLVELKYDAFPHWKCNDLTGTYNPTDGQTGDPIVLTTQGKKNILVFIPNIFYE